MPLNTSSDPQSTSFISTWFTDTPSPKPGDVATIASKTSTIASYINSFRRTIPRPTRTRSKISRVTTAITTATATTTSVYSAKNDPDKYIFLPYLYFRAYLATFTAFIVSTAQTVYASAASSLRRRLTFSPYQIKPFKNIIQDQCTRQMSEAISDYKELGFTFETYKNSLVDYLFPPILTETCFLINPEPHSGARFVINFVSKTVGLGPVLPNAIRCVKCVKFSSGRRRTEHALSLLVVTAGLTLIGASWLIRSFEKKWERRRFRARQQARQREILQAIEELEEDPVIVENPFEGAAEDAIRRAAEAIREIENLRNQQGLPQVAGQQEQDPQAAGQQEQDPQAANQQEQAPEGAAQ